jgi:hypothetical protein
MAKTYTITKDGFAAIHPGFQTEYVHTADTPDEAWEKARENAEDVHGGLATGILASTRTEEVVYPDVPCGGRAWNNTPQKCNEAGHDWVWADDDPDNWPDEVVAYYEDEAGSAVLLITAFGSNAGEWADPDSNDQPICAECAHAGSLKLEGVDDPDADDYDEGENDPEYKADMKALARKLPDDEQGPCYSCEIMWEESFSEPAGIRE